MQTIFMCYTFIGEKVLVWSRNRLWLENSNSIDEKLKRKYFCRACVIDFQDPSSSFLFQYTIMTQKRGTKINISKSNWDFDVRPKDSRYIEINISADAMLHVNHRKNKGMGMKKPSSLMLDFSLCWNNRNHLVLDYSPKHTPHVSSSTKFISKWFEF